MRLLIVGAGGVGGYFGARLLEAKRDVTFLLRPRRAAELARTGLIVRSSYGDIELPSPPHVLAEEIRDPFDVIIVACKSYDLAATMESFAAAVGPEITILPLLNGMRHIDQLATRFDKSNVLGGVCQISSALDPNGAIVHLNEIHKIVFGELDGTQSPRIDAISAAFAGAKFDSESSTQIVQEMWEKWVFIATAAGITCLMRATFGDIVEAGGTEFAKRLYAECAAVAARAGFPPRNHVTERSLRIVTEPGSRITASMLKDIERGAPIEGDQIIGDLLQRGGAPADGLLATVHLHLKSYEARRFR
ncbi:MAG TPA: ketopantoate reductase family protein [Candidatus Acidoferrum sp.]|nr:ketopantoate reductase family protein [Candidatus Acidoferrum sp.]